MSSNGLTNCSQVGLTSPVQRERQDSSDCEGSISRMSPRRSLRFSPTGKTPQGRVSPQKQEVKLEALTSITSTSPHKDSMGRSVCSVSPGRQSAIARVSPTPPLRNSSGPIASRSDNSLYETSDLLQESSRTMASVFSTGSSSNGSIPCCTSAGCLIIDDSSASPSPVPLTGDGPVTLSPAGTFCSMAVPIWEKTRDMETKYKELMAKHRNLGVVYQATKKIADLREDEKSALEKEIQSLKSRKCDNHLLNQLEDYRMKLVNLSSDNHHLTNELSKMKMASDSLRKTIAFLETTLKANGIQVPELVHEADVKSPTEKSSGSSNKREKLSDLVTSCKRQLDSILSNENGSDSDGSSLEDSDDDESVDDACEELYSQIQRTSMAAAGLHLSNTSTKAGNTSTNSLPSPTSSSSSFSSCSTSSLSSEISDNIVSSSSSKSKKYNNTQAGSGSKSGVDLSQNRVGKKSHFTAGKLLSSNKRQLLSERTRLIGQLQSSSPLKKLKASSHSTSDSQIGALPDDKTSPNSECDSSQNMLTEVESSIRSSPPASKGRPRKHSHGSDTSSTMSSSPHFSPKNRSTSATKIITPILKTGKSPSPYKSKVKRSVSFGKNQVTPISPRIKKRTRAQHAVSDDGYELEALPTDSQDIKPVIKRPKGPRATDGSLKIRKANASTKKSLPPNSPATDSLGKKEKKVANKNNKKTSKKDEAKKSLRASRKRPIDSDDEEFDIAFFKDIPSDEITGHIFN